MLSHHIGISQECVNTIRRYICYGDEIHRATIITADRLHCIVLWMEGSSTAVIAGGFNSGYQGEGPRSLAISIRLLQIAGAEIEEKIAPSKLIQRANQSSLSEKDLALIEQTPVRPGGYWIDYCLPFDPLDKKLLWDNYPVTIPYRIIDERLFDIVREFKNDPDAALIKGYRRLEDIVRERISETEHGSKLFQKAFLSKDSKLHWPTVNDEGEQKGRAGLFANVFMAFRNPRAHKETEKLDTDALIELLLLNSLYRLESATKQRIKNNST